jgi:hypothetical protein
VIRRSYLLAGRQAFSRERAIKNNLAVIMREKLLRTNTLYKKSYNRALDMVSGIELVRSLSPESG